MNEFMELAVQEALSGIRQNEGGPFGAVIVCNGEVIATGHNEVLKTNDPTAHAEVVVIRKAAAKLGRFDLSDCEIYITCEPCPMCFAAIHWAKMKRMYYGCTRDDAAESGFDDKFIYDVIRGTAEREQVKSVQMGREGCLKLVDEWKEKTDKVMY